MSYDSSKTGGLRGSFAGRKRLSLQEASAKMRQLRGNHATTAGEFNPGELSSLKPLLYWTYVNFLFCVVPLFLPAFPWVTPSIKYVMVSAIACTLIALWRLQVPIRFVWPIRFLLLLQLWLTFTSYHSMMTLTRSNDFEMSNYFIVMAIIYYIQGTIVAYVWPKTRQLFMNTYIILASCSAIVGFLQFLKFPPAVALGPYYNQAASIINWENRGGVRAMGLSGSPAQLVFHCLAGFSLIASNLFNRSLKRWEFLMCCLFLLVSFMAQSRVLYVSLLIFTIAFLYLLVTRDKQNARLYLGGFAIFMVLLFTLGYDRMQYVLSTDIAKDPTLRWRQDYGWLQAYHILEERPWVGIGPDNNFVWEVMMTTPDRWTWRVHLDNGWLLLICWGGLPAAIMFAPFLITSIGGCIQLVRRVTISHERRVLACMVLAMMTVIINDMFLNNGFALPFLNCIIATFGGLCMPSREEARQEALEGMRRKTLGDSGMIEAVRKPKIGRLLRWRNGEGVKKFSILHYLGAKQDHQDPDP